MTIDAKVQPREGEFTFDARCRALGVDPSKTSLHALVCYERGLDPEKTSPFALECHKYGLDPEKTSFFALKCHKYGLDPMDPNSYRDTRRH